MLLFIKLPKYSYSRFLSDYINIDEVVLRLEKNDDIDMIEYFFYLIEILRKQKTEQQAMVVKNVFLNIENYKSCYDMWYIISSEEIFFIDRVNNDVVIIPVNINCENCKKNKDDKINNDEIISRTEIEIIKPKRKYTRKSKEQNQVESVASAEVKPKRKYTRKSKT